MANLAINRNVDLKASFEWIKLSFCTFRERPLQFMVLGILSSLLGFIPLFGAFISPIFTAKFATLAAKVEHNQEIKFSSLLDDMFNNKIVLRLAFLSFCLDTIIYLGQYLVENILRQHGVSGIEGQSILLLFLLPMMVLQLAMWLSPIICLYNEDIEPKSAMWLSIKAGLYNVPTLILYSLLVFVFTLLAILPIGLGLLIWLPILNIAAYYIYKHLFIPLNPNSKFS